MKRAVHKFVVAITDVDAVEMPVGAEIIHVGEQNGKICLWAIVDLDKTEKKERKIRIAGTGHVIALGRDHFQHLGSVQMQNGLVWHVFEIFN